MLERLLRLVTRLSPEESKKRKSKELACYARRVIVLGNMSFSSINPFVAVPPAYLAVQNMYNFPDTWKIVKEGGARTTNTGAAVPAPAAVSHDQSKTLRCACAVSRCLLCDRQLSAVGW